MAVLGQGVVISGAAASVTGSHAASSRGRMRPSERGGSPIPQATTGLGAQEFASSPVTPFSTRHRPDVRDRWSRVRDRVQAWMDRASQSLMPVTTAMLPILIHHTGTIATLIAASATASLVQGGVMAASAAPAMPVGGTPRALPAIKAITPLHWLREVQVVFTADADILAPERWRVPDWLTTETLVDLMAAYTREVLGGDASRLNAHYLYHTNDHFIVYRGDRYVRSFSMATLANWYQYQSVGLMTKAATAQSLRTAVAERLFGDLGVAKPVAAELEIAFCRESTAEVQELLTRVLQAIQGHGPLQKIVAPLQAKLDALQVRIDALTLDQADQWVRELTDISETLNEILPKDIPLRRALLLSQIQAILMPALTGSDRLPFSQASRIIQKFVEDMLDAEIMYLVPGDVADDDTSGSPLMAARYDYVLDLFRAFREGHADLWVRQVTPPTGTPAVAPAAPAPWLRYSDEQVGDFLLTEFEETGDIQGFSDWSLRHTPALRNFIVAESLRRMTRGLGKSEEARALGGDMVQFILELPNPNAPFSIAGRMGKLFELARRYMHLKDVKVDKG